MAERLRPLSYAAISLLLILVYFVAGKLGLSLAYLHPRATPVWPPTGIAFSALLLLGYRVWPAIFIGAFLVNVTTSGSLATSMGIAKDSANEKRFGAQRQRDGLEACLCKKDQLVFC